MKKILILSLAYYPKFVGGAEVAIKNITDGILPEDTIFDMVTLRLDSSLPRFEKVGNVNVYRIGFAGNNPKPGDLIRFPLYLNKVFYPIMATWKFWRLDRKNHYDGIWAMMSYMGMTAILIRTFVRKISFVLTLQEGDDLGRTVLGRKRIKLFVFLIRKAFREAVVIQAISNYLADWAREMGARKIEVIPNGVSVKNLQTTISNQEPEEIRAGHGINENEKVVITTGRLVEKNGVDVLIKAMKFLPEDVKLLIVGDGPLLRDLQQLTRQTFDEQKLSGQATDSQQLGERVVFTGFVPQEQIFEYLSAGDVFCRMSRTEGQGISFLEAMAVGLPVVATAVGGIPDFIKDKETGLFAKVDDPEDCARKIMILLRDNEIREIVINKGKELVIKDYGWDGITQKIKTLVFDRFVL